MAPTQEGSKIHLGEATETDLLFNILVSRRRFVGGDSMSDETFIVEQSKDFACAGELKRRGLTNEEIDQKVEQYKEHVLKEVRSGKEKLPEELRFLRL